MPGYRKLPDDDKLRDLVKQGKTAKEIADMYGTTQEAARQKLVALGLRPSRLPGRVSHERYVPWQQMNANHQKHILVRYLRDYSRRVQGVDLTEDRAFKLNEFIRFMEGDNPGGVPLSVHYNRHDPEGFWTEARKPGDRDYIHPPS